jgi:hypothetical protein
MFVVQIVFFNDLAVLLPVTKTKIKRRRPVEEDEEIVFRLIAQPTFGSTKKLLTVAHSDSQLLPSSDRRFGLVNGRPLCLKRRALGSVVQRHKNDRIYLELERNKMRHTNTYYFGI